MDSTPEAPTPPPPSKPGHWWVYPVGLVTILVTLVIVDQRDQEPETVTWDAQSFATSKLPRAKVPKAQPTQEPSAEPGEPDSDEGTTDETATTRELPVAVYNSTRVAGLAARKADEVRGKGWNVAHVANWGANPGADTVYYPEGREADARLLGEDLGISTIAPLATGMRPGHLSVILASGN